MQGDGFQGEAENRDRAAKRRCIATPLRGPATQSAPAEAIVETAA